MTNGAWASRASRRASSVVPTPVGPIRMMFAGRISSRMSSSMLQRRQRLRSAIATAFFAAACPMTYLSSSATTWPGVSSWTSSLSSGRTGPGYGRPGARRAGSAGCTCPGRSARPGTGPRPRTARAGASGSRQRLQLELEVGVDADLPRDLKRLAHQLFRRGLRVTREGSRGGERVGRARADRDQAVVRLDDLARPGDDQPLLAVEDGERRVEPRQRPVGAPLLDQRDAGALERQGSA